MREFAAGVLVLSVCQAPLLAQERDRSLARIDLALQQPPQIVSGMASLEIDSPKKLGIFTLVPPKLRGEMVRVSVPVGALVMHVVDGVAAANRRRQEGAARRRVEAALERFTKQARPPRP
jgi:hypothetical protein